MPLPPALLYGLAFVWGAIWGSFLNVCIHRIPAGLSIVHPPSHCPACETPLRAWHNIPILSWLLLRGRCAFCGVRISVRYALVEALMGLLSVAVLARALGVAGGEGTLGPVLLLFVFYFVLVGGLVLVTFIDIEHLEIPNEITLPGVAVGFAASFLVWPESGVLWWHSLLGTAIGGGFVLLLIIAYARLLGREGMGLGDFKLIAMVGAFLGVQSLPFVFFASSVQGLIYALALHLSGGGEVHRRQLAELDARDAAAAAAASTEPPETAAAEPEADSLRTMPIPFGPFIALAAVEWLLFGDRVSEWIASWIG